MKWGKHRISKESVSCEDAAKEEQTSDDCEDEEPEWYKDLRELIFKWAEENPDCLKRNPVLF